MLPGALAKMNKVETMSVVVVSDTYHIQLSILILKPNTMDINLKGLKRQEVFSLLAVEGQNKNLMTEY